MLCELVLLQGEVSACRVFGGEHPDDALAECAVSGSAERGVHLLIVSRRLVMLLSFIERSPRTACVGRRVKAVCASCSQLQCSPCRRCSGGPVAARVVTGSGLGDCVEDVQAG